MGAGERRRVRAANGLIMSSSAVNVFPEFPISAYRVLTGAAIDALRLGTPHDNSLILMARETGLEPATSGVTGRRSNQLSYSPASERRDPALVTCRIG